jgi:hypothetical protein
VLELYTVEGSGFNFARASLSARGSRPTLRRRSLVAGSRSDGAACPLLIGLELRAVELRPAFEYTHPVVEHGRQAGSRCSRAATARNFKARPLKVRMRDAMLGDQPSGFGGPFADPALRRPSDLGDDVLEPQRVLLVNRGHVRTIALIESSRGRQDRGQRSGRVRHLPLPADWRLQTRQAHDQAQDQPETGEGISAGPAGRRQEAVPHDAVDRRPVVCVRQQRVDASQPME